MIQLAVKTCTHCGQLVERCGYQRALRGFQLDDFADIMVEERVVPEWTSSNSSPTSSQQR